MLAITIARDYCDAVGAANRVWCEPTARPLASWTTRVWQDLWGVAPEITSLRLFHGSAALCEQLRHKLCVPVVVVVEQRHAEPLQPVRVLGMPGIGKHLL